jgi:hemoglobin-like flavoprotein
MAMTPEQIKLIKQSFANVLPLSDQVAALFYGRLFEIAPSLKPLFRGDMAVQGRKLMATLAVVVNGLDELDTVLPAASALAKRHVSYGVEQGHYVIVGEALLWTLERGLGEQWTADLADAWTSAYGMLSRFMIDEACGHPRPRSDRKVMGVP